MLTSNFFILNLLLFNWKNIRKKLILVRFSLFNKNFCHLQFGSSSSSFFGWWRWGYSWWELRKKDKMENSWERGTLFDEDHDKNMMRVNGMKEVWFTDIVFHFFLTISSSSLVFPHPHPLHCCFRIFLLFISWWEERCWTRSTSDFVPSFLWTNLSHTSYTTQ